MRAVIQRVSRSEVGVEGKPVGRIGEGILVLLGVERGDERTDAEYLVEKIVNLRIFADDEGKMNRSLAEVKGELLVISQFTLAGDVCRGRRPSFDAAEEPARAKALYDLFMELAAAGGIRVVGGVFGAMMEVSLVNDGPVTFIIDSRKRL
jgi:D-tyrosyl-tRNA(Tyr) deacylase